MLSDILFFKKMNISFCYIYIYIYIYTYILVLPNKVEKYLCILPQKLRFTSLYTNKMLKFIIQSTKSVQIIHEILDKTPHKKGWVVGLKDSCPLVLPNHKGGVPSVGIFLRDPSPYLR